MKLSKTPLILAVDTSCDETSVAVANGRKILANVVSSQVELHKKWGGVVPDIARRAHQENLPVAISEALKRVGLDLDDVEVFAATQGPGLAIDLEVGLHYVQDLAVRYKKPFIPVNHMEGHLLSGLILNSQGNGRFPESDIDKLLPALGLLVSGKHTELIYLSDWGKYEKIGKTLDDAAGEAFDKVGRMLGFGYPGGPIISEFAKQGGANELIDLPIPMERSGDLNFSYSGLKTALLYGLKELEADPSAPDVGTLAHDLSYAFVDAVKKSLEVKLRSAIESYPEVKSLFVGGGVYKNETISRRIGWVARTYGLEYLLPEAKYRGDNAAMIAVAAYRNYNQGDYITDLEKIREVDRIPRLSL